MLPLIEMGKLGEEWIWDGEMENLVIITIFSLPGIKYDDLCLIYSPNIPNCSSYLRTLSFPVQRWSVLCTFSSLSLSGVSSWWWGKSS